MNINIKFSYLYRDSANFKQFGSIIFSNFNSLELCDIEDAIKTKLIDGEYFYTQQWNIPSLIEYNPYSDVLDWHEFECIGMTNEDVNTSQSIDTFLNLILYSV
jgi:hypothetical protein